MRLVNTKRRHSDSCKDEEHSVAYDRLNDMPSPVRKSGPEDASSSPAHRRLRATKRPRSASPEPAPKSTNHSRQTHSGSPKRPDGKRHKREASLPKAGTAAQKDQHGTPSIKSDAKRSTERQCITGRAADPDDVQSPSGGSLEGSRNDDAGNESGTPDDSSASSPPVPRLRKGEATSAPAPMDTDPEPQRDSSSSPFQSPPVPKLKKHNPDGDHSESSASSPFHSPPVPQLSKKTGAEYDIFDESDAVPQQQLVKPVRKEMVGPVTNLSDNWDDKEGYYQIKIGEAIPESGRYVVKSIMGKGVFGTVVMAVDTRGRLMQDGSDEPSEKQVAVKISRNNHVMASACGREVQFLQKIMQSDPNNKSRCIKMMDHFKYRNHVCIVEELMSLNVRQALKKFGTSGGKTVGLNLDAVRLYARDMFVGLRFFQKNGLIHADIKPDNMLLNERKTGVKFCDLGSATLISDFEITPYLVSRYYRAPEIILGTPKPDYGIDVWAVGCTLYEMATGRVLFPGENNNRMLKLFMDLKGKFPNRFLRSAAFRAPHFDDEYNFQETTVDPVSNKEVTKKITFIKATHDIKTLLKVDQCRDEEQKQKLLHFASLLDGCLQLDPVQRLTSEQGFYHPFVYSEKSREAREQKQQEKQARREKKSKVKEEVRAAMAKQASDQKKKLKKARG